MELLTDLAANGVFGSVKVYFHLMSLAKNQKGTSCLISSRLDQLQCTLHANLTAFQQAPIQTRGRTEKKAEEEEGARHRGVEESKND